MPSNRINNDYLWKSARVSLLIKHENSEQQLMIPITWHDFEAVELRAGTVVAVEDFPEARKPAYKVTVDFGVEYGTKRTSAQVTDHYTKEALLGRQVIGVVNFPPKQIGPIMSEFLLVGFYREDGTVILAVPDQQVPAGAKLA